MNFIHFQNLGLHHGSPRLWVESRRLETLGFAPGVSYEIQPDATGTGLLMRPAPCGTNQVSHRVEGHRRRPIIDLNHAGRLAPLGEAREIRVKGSSGLLHVTPSVRGATILRRLNKPTLGVLELFCGGGTLTQAIEPPFSVVAGLEVEPLYADCWQAQNPDAVLVQADARLVHHEDIPPFDVLIAGIPCTEHSIMGRAKKSLAGKPELGEAGDLFLPVLNLVAGHLPAAIVLENVPSFGTSVAGQCLVAYLAKLGYSVTTTVLQPLSDWAEPCNRQRWLCIATLRPGFELKIPQTPFAGTLADYLDPVDEIRDAEDAAQIAGTIFGLRAHNARHAAAGHGFSFTEINRESVSCPIISKSYHKISAGPFVTTPTGPRLLRLPEIERLHGARSESPHYATGVQVLGQGVLTRVFRQILRQLGQHLQP